MFRRKLADDHFRTGDAGGQISRVLGVDKGKLGAFPPIANETLATRASKEVLLVNTPSEKSHSMTMVRTRILRHSNSPLLTHLHPPPTHHPSLPPFPFQKIILNRGRALEAPSHIPTQRLLSIVQILLSLHNLVRVKVGDHHTHRRILPIPTNMHNNIRYQLGVPRLIRSRVIRPLPSTVALSKAEREWASAARVWGSIKVPRRHISYVGVHKIHVSVAV
ncbi:hypothetical protein MVEN_01823500 [Mycena venus]|uniref:Uncharacterized protein n=1 Tax=Mycena venus TaxID=2733690 RepID=A0A8H6XL25_9AGAR|nr:hypothetical protein MVEN_01823500 [Mycena venus]